MNINDYIKKTNVQAPVLSDGGKSIQSCYAGDFLSHVMGSALPGSLWFTVMNNVNVAAVAHLCECAAVVICEGILPDKQLTEKCRQQGINLLTSDLPVYECCAAFAAL